MLFERLVTPASFLSLACTWKKTESTSQSVIQTQKGSNERLFNIDTLAVSLFQIILLFFENVIWRSGHSSFILANNLYPKMDRIYFYLLFLAHGTAA